MYITSILFEFEGMLLRYGSKSKELQNWSLNHILAQFVSKLFICIKICFISGMLRFMLWIVKATTAFQSLEAKMISLGWLRKWK